MFKIQILGVFFHDIFTEYTNAAGIGFIQCYQLPEQRALSGAASPHNDHYFPRVDVEVYALKCGFRISGILDDKVLYLDDALFFLVIRRVR